MTFTADENLTVSITKDGEAVAYTFLENTLSAAGSYTATLTDELGNSKTFNFIITEPLVQKFFHNFDAVSGLGQSEADERQRNAG